uniref:filamentous growth regulator 23-like n=1 Tax=Styela clava TaxID=7725 RepID=UPI00193ACF3E|nr:filamentous growth regulator 23-like [Styela clava]
MYRTILLSFLTIATVVVSHVECTAPDQMTAPTFSLIKSTSITVNFESVTSAVRYHVTVTQRYDSSFTQSFTTTETSLIIVDFIQSTLYDVTVKAENSQGEIGGDSPSSTVQTMPGAPTLMANNPLPTGSFVFFNTPNSARVSQWRLEYREKGTGDSAISIGGGYYGLWLSGLKGDTEYEIRGRALQLNETTTLTESEVDFSAWQTIKTDTLSVFGRVDLVDFTYSSAYSTAYSNEWNSTLAVIQSAYSSVSSVKSINIIRIEDNGGKPVAYYQLRVTDKTLPSATDYTISGSQFSNSIINNGDEAVGTPFILIRDDEYTLAYSPNSSKVCDKLVDRYMLVTPENQDTLEIHLNVVSAEGGAADESDSLIISGTNLLTDDGVVQQTVSPNTVLGFNPKFLVKDCLRNQVSGDNNSSYTQFLSAINLNQRTETVEALFYTTDASASILNISGITVASSSIENIATISIPAVDKAIKYELLNGSTVLNSVTEEDIDGSEYIKVTQQWEQTSQTSLTFTVRVSTRKQDGSTGSITSGAVTITSDREACSSCSSNAFCVTMSSQILSCTCNTGYVGDGVTCSLPVMTTASPTASSDQSITNTTSMITSNSDVDISTSVDSSEGTVTKTTSHISTTSGVASSTRLYYAICFILATISHLCTGTEFF